MNFTNLFSNKSTGNNYTSSDRIKKLKSLGMRVGDDCEIYSVVIYGDPSRVRIGSHVEITSHVCIVTLCTCYYLCDYFVDDGRCNGDVSIGDNSFLGIGAIVGHGSEIGRDCIIGAGAVVTGKIEDGSVVIGNPAQVIMNTSDYEKRKIKSLGRIDTKNISCRAEVEKIICQHFGICPRIVGK